MVESERSEYMTNRDGFENQLRQLLSDARENGVQFEGAYDIRSPEPDERDYQVAISEIVKKRDGPRFP